MIPQTLLSARKKAPRHPKNCTPRTSIHGSPPPPPGSEIRLVGFIVAIGHKRKQRDFTICYALFADISKYFENSDTCNFHVHPFSGGLAFFVWGASSKMAPLQIKHRYQVPDEISSLAIFLMFLLVLLVPFDTLTLSRAECRHLSDRGK